LQYAPTATTFKSPSKTVGAISRGFKSAVTKQINISCNMPNVPVWQRNYYEHVVRNDYEFERIQEYIQNNPLNWNSDRYNPLSKVNDSGNEDEKLCIAER
jgi:putative transposase